MGQLSRIGPAWQPRVILLDVSSFVPILTLCISGVLPVGFSRCHQIRVEVSQATDYLNSLNQDVKLEESSYLEDELVDLYAP